VDPTPEPRPDPPALARLEGLDTDRTTTKVRKPSKWDRPKPPKDWRWWIGGVGRVLIAVGVLMFLFVGYQLWGTSIEEAQAQNRLEDQFAELQTSLSTSPPPSTTEAPEPPTEASVPTTSPAPATTVPAPIEVREGDPIAIIEIPRIGVQKIVVAGVQPDDLKKGPGHYPFTPLPGQLGNAAIAGHRTTYGEPFRQLDELEPGDEIKMTTATGEVFVYRVTGSLVVSPSDSWVLDTVDPEKATLTLTTCHPEFTARERLIVFSELDESVSPAPTDGPLTYGLHDDSPEATIPGDDPTVTSPDGTDATDDTGPDDTGPDDTGQDDGVPGGTSPTPGGGSGTAAEASADAFNAGWFSDPDAWPQVALWGTALSLIAVGAYLLSRRFRSNWVGGLVGIVPFTIALYFFFQNVNRLLPPNL
jgi:sortase A